jgi:hypothetical protein
MDKIPDTLGELLSEMSKTSDAVNKTYTEAGGNAMYVDLDALASLPYEQRKATFMAKALELLKAQNPDSYTTPEDIEWGEQVAELSFGFVDAISQYKHLHGESPSVDAVLSAAMSQACSAARMLMHGLSPQQGAMVASKVSIGAASALIDAMRAHFAAECSCPQCKDSN